MATSFRCWTRCAWLKLKKSGIRSGPRRLRLVSNHCGIGHVADDLKRTGSFWAGEPMLRLLLRFLGLACLISQGRVMTNNALIYRRPSKWPIAAALTAAVLIHLSAVAIAFHQESPAILPAATDPTTIGVYFADSSRSGYFRSAARTGSGRRVSRASRNPA